MLGGGKVFEENWHRTHDGKQYFSGIVRNGKRKIFGSLESPMLTAGLTYETVSYKIFISGKAGVGKSSTVAKLCGLSVPKSHLETPGLQTSVVYWPVKLADRNGKVVMFKLQLWDAGENILKKFDHILPACTENANAMIFLFSYTDRPSFEALPAQMAQICESNIPKIVIGTKFEQLRNSDITTKEIYNFRERYSVPLMNIKNVSRFRLLSDGSKVLDGNAEIEDVANIMNGICEVLWNQQDTGQIAVPLDDSDDSVQYSYV
ncbi:ciliogenesis and planar polarity effector 2-like [Antedon mediterranea]|uniref:ciliogenesis and planar polarity effector 2-like n=1 Tax=Antedon mediterranea TaxID=105859 RepID=UPI003AF703C5